MIRCKTQYSTCLTVWDQIGNSRPGDDGLALGVAVKPHAFGVPLTRFQGLTAPPRQARNELMPCLPKKSVSRESESQNVLTLSEKSNAEFPRLGYCSRNRIHEPSWSHSRRRSCLPAH